MEYGILKLWWKIQIFKIFFYTSVTQTVFSRDLIEWYLRTSLKTLASFRFIRNTPLAIRFYKKKYYTTQWN